MAWKSLGPDRKIDVILDPDFRGDLIEMAHVRPLWIVDTPQNESRIRAAWERGKTLDIFYINKFFIPEATDRGDSLIRILDSIDDHHGSTESGSYDGIILHGLTPNDLIREKLGKLGFEITSTTSDGFVANGTLQEPIYMRGFSEI